MHSNDVTLLRLSEQVADGGGAGNGLQLDAVNKLQSTFIVSNRDSTDQRQQKLRDTMKASHSQMSL